MTFDDGDYERARSLASRACEWAKDPDPALGQAPLHAQATRRAADYDEAA